MTFRISEQAEQDIRGIAEFIRADESVAAARFLGRLESNFVLLTEQPHIGRSRNDIADGVRTLPFASYIIFYRVTDAIEIERIFHSALNIGGLEDHN